MASVHVLHENDAWTASLEGVEADKDEAAKWYHRAGQLFLKAGRLEDMEMAIASLNGLTSDHPLGAKLRGLMAQQRESG